MPLLVILGDGLGEAYQKRAWSPEMGHHHLASSANRIQALFSNMFVNTCHQGVGGRGRRKQEKRMFKVCRSDWGLRGVIFISQFSLIQSRLWWWVVGQLKSLDLGGWKYFSRIFGRCLRWCGLKSEVQILGKFLLLFKSEICTTLLHT